MAAEDRTNPSSLALLQSIQRAPGSFDLFQALRRIECAHRDGARLGEGTHPADEPIRLKQEPTLAFRSTPIADVTWRGDGVAELVTAFFGLQGPFGPLPLHLTEYARQRGRGEGDPTLSDFLDLFHHRILSLYYRAYANTEPTVSYDRPETDRFGVYVASLVGMGMPSFLERDDLPDHVRWFFAGRYASQARNAEGLASIVHAYFGINARVQEFIGEWVGVPESSRWRIGGPGVGSPLGRRTALGRRAWVCQGKFRVVLGPVDHEQFSRMLPGGDGLTKLAALVRSYAGDSLAWDLMLVLDDAAGTPWCLGGDAKLGHTAWLGRRPSTIIVQPPEPNRDRPSSRAEVAA